MPQSDQRSQPGTDSGRAYPMDERPPAMSPGDEAPPGTPGTGEDMCRRCSGSGQLENGQKCDECAGTGWVTVGIGGA